MKRHMEVLGVFGLAFAAVALYSLWGVHVLSAPEVPAQVVASERQQ